MREIISEALAHRVNDPCIAPLTTVSRVLMAGDLTVATVYLTVQGDAATERRTMAAIGRATGFLKKMLASELTIRQCPELRFEVDEAAKQVRETMRLLDENRRNRADADELELDLDDDAGGEAVASDEERADDHSVDGDEESSP